MIQMSIVKIQLDKFNLNLHTLMLPGCASEATGIGAGTIV